MSNTVCPPALRSRSKTALPVGWRSKQRANYYFDASHQSVKTLRILLAEWAAGTKRMGLQSPASLLASTMEALFVSIRPDIEDDEESRNYFRALLNLHLAGLSAAELTNLQRVLKSEQFVCYVVENIIDDPVYLDYGFANGAPHSRTRTLMQSQEFYDVLDDLQQQAIERETSRLPISTTTNGLVRAALTDCAVRWSASAMSLTDITETARALATALDVPLLWHTAIAAEPESRASMVGGKDGQLLIHPDVVAHLARDGDGSLFAAVMRDLLELLLMQKLFGADHLSQSLTTPQRQRLHDAIDEILDLPPTATANQQKQAAAVLADSADFGQVHIIPTKGVALGHAWIAPKLSLLPDTTTKGVAAGTCFMHSGFQLKAGESSIREWPMRFVNETENNHLFPADVAWHLRVPVDSLRLQVAAASIVKEWRANGLLYRFIGTRPGVNATGCRISVWQAVQRGMDDDALALFHHYNRGLPEPESPTELWLRLDGMMRWLEQIKSGVSVL